MQGGDAAMSARAKSRVSRWFVLLFATLTVCGAVLATPATAIDTPIGRLVHAVKMPVPYAMGLSFVFKGVTPTGGMSHETRTPPTRCNTQFRTCPQVRPSTAACGGTAIEIWSPMWCLSTR